MKILIDELFNIQDQQESELKTFCYNNKISTREYLNTSENIKSIDITNYIIQEGHEVLISSDFSLKEVKSFFRRTIIIMLRDHSYNYEIYAAYSHYYPDFKIW